jgi:hypothetical protein
MHNGENSRGALSLALLKNSLYVVTFSAQVSRDLEKKEGNHALHQSMKLWRNIPRAKRSQPGVESEAGRTAFVDVPVRTNRFVGWIRTNKALFVMIMLVGLIALVPLYGVLFPPLVDLPEHILISKLLWEKLSGISHLDLEISRLLGYRLFPIFMMIVLPLCKAGGISFVYVPIIVAMALISIHVMVVGAILCSGLKSRSWKSCALAACFVTPAVVGMYSACWFIGFVNYTLAVTLLILAIFLTERFLRSGKLLDALFLFFTLLLVYTSHPFAPAFWLMWCFSRALAGFATQTFFREWKRLLCLGLIFAPVLLYHFRATRATTLAPSSGSLLNQSAIVSINDWYQHRFRAILDGVYLQADDAADSSFFARFAIGIILCAALFAFRAPQNKHSKNVMLASILLLFLSSWVNEKFIPVPGAAWLAYDYRFASTLYAICLAAAGVVLIRLLPVSTDKLQYKLIFSFLGIVSVIASVGHLIEVRKAYARFDVQARKYMAKVFKHESASGIHLPHSRWHPDGTLIKLYRCLEEPDCNPEGTTFFTGYVSDLYPVKFRSTARVLSAREIESYRRQVPTGPLVGYWKLDEDNAGDVCVDASGNGNTGVPHGTSVVIGKINRGRTFNGRGDYIDIAPISIANAITVAAWVYSENFMQSGFVVTKNPVNTQWALFFQSDRFLRWRGAGSDNDVKCPAPANGAWHHIVGRQEGTAGSLFVDGVLCASGTVSAIGNGPTSINIGRFDSGDHWYFSGQIDEVRIYNRALSDTEISQLYTVGDPIARPPSPNEQAKQ